MCIHWLMRFFRSVGQRFGVDAGCLDTTTRTCSCGRPLTLGGRCLVHGQQV